MAANNKGDKAMVITLEKLENIFSLPAKEVKELKLELDKDPTLMELFDAVWRIEGQRNGMLDATGQLKGDK